MLYYLLERAVRHARGLGLSCRTVQVWIDYVENGRAAAARSLATPTDQDAEVFALARRLLVMLFTRRDALRRVGVALSHFSADAALRSRRPLLECASYWRPSRRSDTS